MKVSRVLCVLICMFFICATIAPQAFAQVNKHPRTPAARPAPAPRPAPVMRGPVTRPPAPVHRPAPVVHPPAPVHRPGPGPGPVVHPPRPGPGPGPAFRHGTPGPYRGSAMHRGGPIHRPATMHYREHNYGLHNGSYHRYRTRIYFNRPGFLPGYYVYRDDYYYPADFIGPAIAVAIIGAAALVAISAAEQAAIDAALEEGGY